MAVLTLTNSFGVGSGPFRIRDNSSTLPVWTVLGTVISWELCDAITGLALTLAFPCFPCTVSLSCQFSPVPVPLSAHQQLVQHARILTLLHRRLRHAYCSLRTVGIAFSHCCCCRLPPISRNIQGYADLQWQDGELQQVHVVSNMVSTWLIRCYMY